jgi:hypothetical protein
MSKDPLTRKEIWLAGVLLRRAAALVPAARPISYAPAALHNIDVARARVVGLQLPDFLEATGRDWDPQGAFWRDLMRVCEALDIPERLPSLKCGCKGALQSVGLVT